MAQHGRSQEQVDRDTLRGHRIGKVVRGEGGVAKLAEELKRQRVVGASHRPNVDSALSGARAISNDLERAIYKLHPNARVHSPAEIDALNARLTASDRAVWQQRFADAMVTGGDHERAQGMGAAAADAALAEMCEADPRAYTMLNALVRFAGRASAPGLAGQPGEAGLQRVGEITGAAAHVLVALSESLSSVDDVVGLGPAANASGDMAGFLFARLCDDVLASMIGLLVAERADNHRGRPISAHP